jgi:endonuclease/exonuclease/phosphatase (EEP) superfamily protein YafD
VAKARSRPKGVFVIWTIFFSITLIERFFMAPRSDQNWLFYTLTEGFFFSDLALSLICLVLSLLVGRSWKVIPLWVGSTVIATVLILAPVSGSPKPSPPGSLKILTYNIAHCRVSSPDAIVGLLRKTPADIFCLQEASILDQDTYKLKKRLEQEFLGWNIYFATNNLILTRFPITKSSFIDAPTKWAKKQFPEVLLSTPLGPLRVICVHCEPSWVSPFQTSLAEVQRVTDKVASDRTRQREMLIERERKSKEPIIIAGDMNGSAFSQLPSALAKDMIDCQAATSRGFVMTLLPKLPYTRIDFVFGKGIQPLNSQLIGKYESDHKGVLVEFSR